MKELNVSCPCCKGKLVVDAETGRVINSQAYKKENISLEEFMNTQDDRKKDLDDMFEKGKKEEDTKMDYLNKKFEWAKKNQDKLPNKPDRKIFWD